MAPRIEFFQSQKNRCIYPKYILISVIAPSVHRKKKQNKFLGLFFYLSLLYSERNGMRISKSEF